MEAQADLTRVGDQDQQSRQYPSFVRGGVRITPTWRTFNVGDTIYDIANDAWLMCMKEHTTLAANHDNAMGEPNSGNTPRELGYTEDGRYKGEPYRCAIPKWLTDKGVSADDFAAAVLELLAGVSAKNAANQAAPA